MSLPKPLLADTGALSEAGGLNLAVAGEILTVKRLSVKELYGVDRTRTWTRQAVKPVHLNKGSLLIGFIGKSAKSGVKKRFVTRIIKQWSHTPNEAITTRDTGGRIKHNFGALAACEWTDKLGCPVITKTEHWVAENGDKIRIRGLWGQISNKNTVFLLRGGCTLRACGSVVNRV